MHLTHTLNFSTLMLSWNLVQARLTSMLEWGWQRGAHTRGWLQRNKWLSGPHVPFLKPRLRMQPRLQTPAPQAPCVAPSTLPPLLLPLTGSTLPSFPSLEGLALVI